MPEREQGITALQMDIKVSGVSVAMMREALAQAKKARLQILDTMEPTISSGRTEISTYAPHLYMLQIPTDKIRDLIGPGGKKIRGIIEATGVKIDVMDDGKVHVFANNGTAAESALKMIRDVTATAEIGKTYLGTVVRIAEFGAFVEIFPGTDGLLHISEIAEARIRAVRDELKEGDQILVKVLAIEGNKIRLSRKAVLRDKLKQQKPEPSSRVTELQLEVARGGERSPPLFYSSRLADAFDTGADCAELFFDLFVAAVDVVDAVNPGCVVGDKRGEDEPRAGAQIGGSDGCSAQRCRPGDGRQIAIDYDVGAHAHHFAGVKIAIFENGFAHARDAVRLRGQRHELSLHVGGEAADILRW